MSEPREGDRIGNYLLQHRLGVGSFGEVWKARHHVFEEWVALKIPTHPDYVRYLQREGLAIHGVRHPNVVRALDIDITSEPPYLVMELVDGASVREVIDAHRASLPVDTALTIMRGLLKGLAAAHAEGLIHRDIKPANILLARSLDALPALAESDVKVTDFGLGGNHQREAMMQSMSLAGDEGKQFAGTLAYMSPEQKEGADLDARSDLYSSGIVLFELLTGERPQGIEAPGSLRGDVPRTLDEVFHRAYTRRDRRFVSAEQMLEALNAASGRFTGGIRHTGRPIPPPLPGGPRRQCPGCSAEVSADDHFCIRCGQQLVTSVPRCRACKAFVNRNDRFCIFCGHDLQVLS